VRYTTEKTASCRNEIRLPGHQISNVAEQIILWIAALFLTKTIKRIKRSLVAEISEEDTSPSRSGDSTSYS
jgi:hypothetical protein